MSPKQTAIQIEAAIQAANEKLNKIVERTQFGAYDSILVQLKDLELDGEGYIIQNSVNRKVIRQVGKAFDNAINGSGYTTGLSDFLSTLQTIDSINASYFSTIDSSAIASAQLLKSLQQQTITQIEAMLLNDGLSSQIKQPLLSILNQNINSGGSYSGLVEQVKTYVVGVDNDGKLLRYTKQITQDILNNYSRAQQSAIGDKLGLVFYQYIGGLMTESRDFCRDRVNGYFHFLEIESWASLDWKGKNALTTKSSIFILAGGHNCQHQMIPVSTFVVPADQLDRSKELGFYKP